MRSGCMHVIWGGGCRPWPYANPRFRCTTSAVHEEEEDTCMSHAKEDTWMSYYLTRTHVFVVQLAQFTNQRVWAVVSSFFALPVKNLEVNNINNIKYRYCKEKISESGYSDVIVKTSSKNE
jgi:hypothetical protein